MSLFPIIALEGPRGVGKSTLAHAVAEVLSRERSIDVGSWSHPAPATSALARDPYSLAMFYALSREEMRLRMYRPLIVDRWHWSTYVVALGLSATTDDLYRARAMIPLWQGERDVRGDPSLTVLLSAPDEVRRARAASRGGPVKRLSDGEASRYADLAREHGWPVVDTNRDPDVVVAELATLCAKVLGP